MTTSSTYRVVGELHTMTGLPHAVQELARSVDSIRHTLIAAAGVSLTELRAMSRIAENPRLNPKALAEHLEVSMPAVTALTNSLVQRELLSRSNGSNDRRKVELELTASGHVLIDFVLQAFDRAILAAAQGFSPELNASVTQGLEQINLALAREGGARLQ